MSRFIEGEGLWDIKLLKVDLDGTMGPVGKGHIQ